MNSPADSASASRSRARSPASRIFSSATSRPLQQRLHLTYVFISHNLAVVSQIADRVGVMYLGRIVELATTAQLFSRPRHPYTRMLLDAVPDLAMSGKPRIPIAGEVPNPLAPPPGCAFHPRCPHANERCRRERPQVLDQVACHAVEERRINLAAQP
jgi:peptide/nickel transport system ATP-binding protein